MPTASFDILLPFYGDMAYMKAAVNSVRGQDDRTWRLQVLDDCNPDASIGRWLEELEDPRIEYQRSATNLGIDRAFQRVLDMASADYIVFLGCDDIMLPNYISSMRRLVDGHPEAVMFQPGVDVIDENGKPSRGLAERVKEILRPGGGHRVTLSGESLAVSLLRGNWTYFPAMCWRREPVQEVGFRKNLQVVQDLALMLDLVGSGAQMLVDPEVAFLYRRHRASLSSVRANTGSRFTEESDLFQSARAEYAARGWNRAARAASLHLTSRFNAAARIPPAIISGQFRSVPTMIEHVAGR